MKSPKEMFLIAVAGSMILFSMTLFWKLIVMPYQQGSDLRGCIDNTRRNLSGAISYCESRAKYPSFK